MASSGTEGIQCSWLQVCILPSKSLSELQRKVSVDYQGSTKIPERESLCRLESMRTTVYHTCRWKTICPATQPSLLSYCCHPCLGLSLKKGLSPCSWLRCATAPELGGHIGLCCHPTGKCSILMMLAQASYI